MIEKITEFIYELRHDPVMSERIGFLSSQQRLAANRAVDILNSRPTTSLPDLILQIIDWWRQDDRAKGQLKAMKDGAKEVWLENDRNRREREIQRTRVDDEHDEHDIRSPKRLVHRSRKSERSEYVMFEPPLRRDKSTFQLIGKANVIQTAVVLRTKTPVPDEIYRRVRGFRLVEVRHKHRGANGVLRSRRYALHLQVTLKYPDPPPIEAVQTPGDVLAIDDSIPGLLVLSNGETIEGEGFEAIRREEEARTAVSRKKRGSKRQAKLVAKVEKDARKRKANQERWIRQSARTIYQKTESKAVAIQPSEYRARKCLPRRGAWGGRKGPLLEAVLSESMRVMIDEAQKQGIRVYTLMPRDSVSYRVYDRRHSDRSDNQASVNNAHETETISGSARVLQNRAARSIELTTDRTITEDSAQKRRRVKPSRGARGTPCDTQSVAKPKSDDRDYGRGSSLKAGLPQGKPDAKRQLTSSPNSKYIITDELYPLLDKITDANMDTRTHHAYVSQMAHWMTWAIFNSRVTIPANPRDLALYLVMYAEEGQRFRGLRKRCKAISHYHYVLGFPDPVTDEVKDVLRGIRNFYGNAAKPARGLSRKHFEAIKASELASIDGTSTEEERKEVLKTIGLISLMRDALLRSGEAAALTCGDITTAPNGGGRVLIRRSKTDPFGTGAVLAVSTETMNYVSTRTEGRKANESVFGWTRGMLIYRIQEAGKRAGLGSSFSGHSPRRGMAQELSRRGMSLEDLMEVGRWDNVSVAAQYTVEDDPDDGAVARFYEDMPDESPGWSKGNPSP